VLRAAAARREAAGLRRSLVPRGPSFDGLLDLASNDYLGLHCDPRVIAGAVSAAYEWGAGSTGSRLVTGSTRLHAALESALASFTGAEAALVFSSGYLANVSVVTALASILGPGVLIVSDERNHASLIDGCRLARGATVRVTPHLDVAAVRAALAARPPDQPALVVSDAVFSVDGAVAPVGALSDVARSYGALLVLDEAHALGVLGPGGRGVCVEAGVADESDVVRTVTLSKALGSQGGAVLGAAEVIDTLVDTGRGFIFDTGLAPASAGAALAALSVLAAEPSLPSRALDMTQRMAALVAEHAGLSPLPPSASVLCVPLGSPERAVGARDACLAAGVRVGCFRPPSVPDGSSCLRLTGRATLSPADLDTLSQAMDQVRGHVGVDVPVVFGQ
jgi:8-amino-7-oxononanoate synthase